mgnify:CR=1 FL=1
MQKFEIGNRKKKMEIGCSVSMVYSPFSITNIYFLHSQFLKKSRMLSDSFFHQPRLQSRSLVLLYDSVRNGFIERLHRFCNKCGRVFLLRHCFSAAMYKTLNESAFFIIFRGALYGLAQRFLCGIFNWHT